MPTVARLSIAPVKGLALEHPQQVELTERGVAEDRRFFLVDTSGRLVDGLIVGAMVQVAAHTNPDGTHLALTFPDGRVVDGEVRQGEPLVTRMYGRTVHGHVVDGPWAEALEPLAGRRVRFVRATRPGGTREAHPATILSDGSLTELGAHLGNGPVDGRRFRMLIELEGCSAHEEDGWIGRSIGLGTATMLVGGPVPRCAIPTHDPDTGRRDQDTLRAIIEYRGLRNDRDVDFGVFGEVVSGGTIRVGDSVRLLGSA